MVKLINIFIVLGALLCTLIGQYISTIYGLFQSIRTHMILLSEARMNLQNLDGKHYDRSNRNVNYHPKYLYSFTLITDSTRETTVHETLTFQAVATRISRELYRLNSETTDIRIQFLSSLNIDSREDPHLPFNEEMALYHSHQESASMRCSPALRCKQVTIALQMHHPGHSSDDNTIVKSKLQPVSVFIKDIGCFISLILTHTDELHDDDADAIYKATAEGIHCIRRLHGLSVLYNSSSTDKPRFKQLSPGGGELQLLNEEVQNHKIMIVQDLLNAVEGKLSRLLQLYGLSISPWRVILLSHENIELFSEIFHILQELRTSGKVNYSTYLSSLRRIFALLVVVETSVEGRLREIAPFEQYLAIYGPFWLPLLVPAGRALRLLSPSS